MQFDSLGYVMTSQQLILAVSKPGLTCAKAIMLIPLLTEALALTGTWSVTCHCGLTAVLSQGASLSRRCCVGSHTTSACCPTPCRACLSGKPLLLQYLYSMHRPHLQETSHSDWTVHSMLRLHARARVKEHVR